LKHSSSLVFHLPGKSAYRYQKPSETETRSTSISRRLLLCKRQDNSNYETRAEKKTIRRRDNESQPLFSSLFIDFSNRIFN
jgi:hypothetical protein